MASFAWLGKIFRDLFTEDGSKWSLTRVSSAACVVATLCWVTWVVHRTNALPDLNGPTFFLFGGAAHLGVGKLSEYFNAKLGGGNGNAPNGGQ